MPDLIFTDCAGQTRGVSAPDGLSVMEAARQNQVPGIVAECGGVCACATCHVYVDEAWLARLDPPGPVEEALLEFLSDGRPNSRLSCQIVLTAALDGLSVRTPEHQGS